MAYIGNSPGSIQRGRRAVYEFTATNAQTVFSGTDDNGISLDLQDSNENDVYLNGSRLIFNDDYTIAGEVLTLTAAAAAGDILVIVTQDDIANVASYTKAETDARYINYDGDIVNGDIQVVGNITADGLTVDGIARLQGGAPYLYLDNSSNTGSSRIYFGDSDSDITGYFLYDHSSNSLRTGVNGAERMRIDSSGRVGIGTSSPDYPLHVKGGTNILKLETTTNSRTQLGGFDSAGSTNFVIGSPNSTDAEFWNYKNGYLRFATNSTERMRISSSGNVGIGTDNPQQKLHVTSSVLIEGGSTDSRTLGFTNASGSTGWSIGNGVIDSTHNFRIYDNTAGAARLTVDGSGNLGVGTSSPVAKLEVVGKIAAGFESGYTGSSNAGGHIRATVASNNTAQGGLVIGGGSTTDDNHSIWFRVGKDNTVDTTSYYQYGEHRFYTGGVIDTQLMRMKIDSAGRVTTPYQPAASFKSSTSTTNTQRFGAVSVGLNNGNNLDTGSNSGRFNCPVTGMYRVTINTSTAYNGHYGWIGIRKNGTLQLDHIHWNKGGTSMHVNPSIQLIIQCSSGDYLEGWYINANSVAQDVIDMAMITMELIG